MTEPIRTLVVDDDKAIRFFLSQTLEGEGHTVTLAPSGEVALEWLLKTSFDLAILDLRLGGRIDGIRVLEAVNWRWPHTAKIILTGHGSLDSAVHAIREGIDAYLFKPVKAQELRQTVKEVLERQHRLRQAAQPSPEHDLLRQGAFSVDMQRRLAEVDGQALPLTADEFSLLAHLVRNTDRVIPPPELVRVVRGYECDHLQEARDIIKWYIHRLRRKVEANPSQPRHILNVRGVGYTFRE
jgi:DNA-binding response OmpR family regulator